MRSKRYQALEARKSKYGLMFILPWIIGFIMFFLVPLVQSVMFSFSQVTLTTNGFMTKFVSLRNYYYALAQQPDYQQNLQTSVGNFAYSLPIIIILSLILGVMLNQKFKGRVVARAIFFLPVIIASGVVLQIFDQDVVATQMREVSNNGSTYLYGSIDFIKVISNLGLPKNMIQPIIVYISEIFNLIWKCGVQIILFIAGLQSIPDQLYEVSRVEGATAWEEFWFITFPMLSNVFILVIIYTTIDLFTNSDNAVMNQAYELILNQQNYDQSSAMLWIYFALVGLIIAVIMLVVNHIFKKNWE